MRHVLEDGMIGLEDLPALIESLEGAFGDPDRVATSEWKIWEIEHKHSEFSQFNHKFQVIAKDLDGNPTALRNTW